MKIVVLHAYSSTNSGDGLLVAEALDLVNAAFDSPHVLVLALDPDSFRSVGNVTYIHPLTGAGATPSTKLMLGASIKALLRGSRLPRRVREAVRDADLVVAVGGGYMRGATLTEAIKTYLAHVPQTEAAILNGSSVYLPQSVGPFRYLPTPVLAPRLRKVGTYFVRDDRSLDLFKGASNARRAPDNALLALATIAPASRNGSGIKPIGLVARSLSSTRTRTRHYVSNIRALRELTGAELLVQASARGNDDGHFYRNSLGFSASARSLVQATSAGQDRVGVVVSVRLHGAIQSIRNGVPAVHLSYERKGWGAYEDLGLAEYVHNAFDFDPAAVADQLSELASAPQAYWTQVDNAVESLRSSREEILSAVRGGL
ncbi:polysaccharide pyruvyl transferase family protein [Microbacterium sp. LMI12-1-1.1]|uniref:polysaccharide pyruvyl transferase family protein n=1 Tax=Microbacterium sp. LMI12-1-1.1 TaxID=3135225 RepID=UPI00342D613F